MPQKIEEWIVLFVMCISFSMSYRRFRSLEKEERPKIEKMEQGFLFEERVTMHPFLKNASISIEQSCFWVQYARQKYIESISLHNEILGKSIALEMKNCAHFDIPIFVWSTAFFLCVLYVALFGSL